MNERSSLTLIAVALLVPLSIFNLWAEASTSLKIFHAGSLSVPLKRVAEEFEEMNPEVNVQLEAHGSVLAVRQVTQVGKRGDVVAVADYSLIPSMMIPDYADFYLQFARNEIVIAHTENSALSGEVSKENWYKVLADPDVRFGFSNPNMDPCGYRSLMVSQLAELHYSEVGIFDDLIVDNTDVTVKEEDGGYVLDTSEPLRPNTAKVSIRNKEVDLVSMLQSGGLDYAFEYRSLAEQHGLQFVSLPEEVNLSSTEHSEAYGKVSVRTDDGDLKKAKPIVYGVTIPEGAPNPDLAREFVSFMVSEKGREIFSELGQPPIVPARGFGEVPEGLEELVE
ncbi:MAG: tungstate ABC transporter substrate-binding protein WtpA [Candidatus Acetothermia bacterium]